MALAQELLSSIAMPLLFTLKKMYLLFLGEEVSTACTQCQTLVNEYRLSLVRLPCKLCTSPLTATPLCPAFVFPLCLNPLLLLSSLTWKGFFLRLTGQ